MVRHGQSMSEWGHLVWYPGTPWKQSGGTLDRLQCMSCLQVRNQAEGGVLDVILEIKSQPLTQRRKLAGLLSY